MQKERPLIFTHNEIIVRMLHFLVRKNYLAAEQMQLLGMMVPAPVIQSIKRGEQDYIKIFKSLLHRILVVKARIKNPDELFDAIIKLSNDMGALQTSFEKYLLTTPDFKTFYEEWKKNNPDTKH